MPFERGQSGNPEGRPKGSSNKVTKTLRDAISGFLEDRLANIDELYETLSPRTKAEFITNLLQYAIPKLQSNDIRLGQLSDEQLDQLYESITSQLNEFKS